MGATRTTENKHRVYEISVWHDAEQVQEQDFAVPTLARGQKLAGLMPVQEQDTADLMFVREQDSANLLPAREQDGTTEEAQMSPIVVQRKRSEVPIQEKVLLTLEEAAEYTGLGMQKLRNISNFESCKFVLWNGTKRMFKRRELEVYLANAYSI